MRHRQQGLLLQVAAAAIQLSGTERKVVRAPEGVGMRRCGLLPIVVARIVIACAVAAAMSANALAAPFGMSGDHADRSSGLIIEIKKKKNCTVAFVCDFFNPATSCANPPCCKKGHTEKECEPAGQTPNTTPAPAPEPTAGQCNLCTNKGECSPAGPPAECADHKAAAEKLNVTPFLKWSCVCK